MQISFVCTRCFPCFERIMKDLKMSYLVHGSEQDKYVHEKVFLDMFLIICFFYLSVHPWNNIYTYRKAIFVLG